MSPFGFRRYGYSNPKKPKKKRCPRCGQTFRAETTHCELCERFLSSLGK